MKLNSLNRYISLLILFFPFQFLFAEDQIDIWNKEIKKKSEINILDKKESKKKESNIYKSSKINTEIQIENETLNSSQNIKIFGTKNL